MHRLKTLLAAAAIVMAATGCQVHDCSTIEPTICYSPQSCQIAELPSPFEPVAGDDASSDWAKELRIGVAFARDLDLYRAITAFRRAQILLGCNGTPDQMRQIEYEIFLAYYIGGKYPDAIQAFECSSLTSASSSFPAYRTLLIALYDAYQKTGGADRACKVLELINAHEPEAALSLEIFNAVENADIDAVEALAPRHSNPEQIQSMIDCYRSQAKSPRTAQTLAAIVPGAGFLYVEQRSSALTSFLLNGLFIAATVTAFHHHNVALGIILGGFEMGWYLGGINGSGLAAKEYNERLYESCTRETLMCERLFPVLMLSFAF